MNYLCLIYSDDPTAARLPRAERIALEQEHLDFDDELRRSGHYVVAQALEVPEAAVVVRVRHGKVSVTDGPFVETKEQLGGFFLIEARDLNEAIQIAGRIPAARTGHVEVRAVRELTLS